MSGCEWGGLGPRSGFKAQQRGQPMSTERPEEFSQPSPSKGEPSSSGRQTTVNGPGDTAQRTERHDDASRPETTVLVRGETLRDQEPRSVPKESPREPRKEKSSRQEVSEAKVKMQSRLPGLADDADVGVQKEHLITRDGKADLTFTGTLLASAAPESAPQGTWKEYRIYATNGGKHVFSKITRSVEAEKQDTHEAEVFDPAPSSVPSKLLKSARELTHSRPLTWTDAAVAFFGYDPLAKVLYRKLDGQFDEHIS
jgi:hypothetical protein